jgi:hypothetical protein
MSSEEAVKVAAIIGKKRVKKKMFSLLLGSLALKKIT